MRNITDSVPELPEAGAEVQLPSFQAGSDVDRYLAAAKAAADAEKTMEELKPKLKELGMEAVFQHNCENPPEKRVKSSTLIGALKEGKEVGRLLATCVDKSLKLDAKKIAAALARVETVDGKKPNPDRYTHYQIVAEFDTACVHDAKGRIDPERFAKVETAFAAAAKSLGIENPLVFAKQLVFTEAWWEDRFDRFDAVTLVELCTDAMPQQVNFKKAK
jgi:hypothetical protein